jgi:hypothetical protein
MNWAGTTPPSKVAVIHDWCADAQPLLRIAQSRSSERPTSRALEAGQSADIRRADRLSDLPR